VRIKLNTTFQWHFLLSQVYFKHTVLLRLPLCLSSGQHHRTCFVSYIRLSWQFNITGAATLFYLIMEAQQLLAHSIHQAYLRQ